MYIKKDITTTADDYREIVHFTEFHRKKSNYLIIALSIVLAAAGVLLGVLNVYPIWVGIIIAAVCLMLIPIVFIRINKKVKDGIKYGKVALNATRTLELTPSSINIFGGRTETDVSAKWDTVFAVYELEKSFIIYLTQNSAFCVNKAQLSLNEIYDMRNEFIRRIRNRFFKKCD